MVVRLPQNLRVPRTIPTILTCRDMLRVALDPIMDPDMAIITAITVVMALDIGVGLEGYLFSAEYRNSSAECQYPSRSGFNKWNTIFPSQVFQRGNP